MDEQTPIRTLLIDDEGESREAIRLLIEQEVPELSIVAEADSVNSGITQLQKVKPDLLLLDIQLSDGLGFDLLESITETHTRVIFITAYSTYAVRAFELAALDYLLKPLKLERLQQSIQRFREYGHTTRTQQLTAMHGHILQPENQENTIALPTQQGFSFIAIKEIEYIKGTGSYAEVHLTNGQHELVSQPLAHFERLLQEYRFCRIHRAYLINLNHLKRYHKGRGGEVELGSGKYIEVARRRKEAFLALIKDPTATSFNLL